MLSRLLSSAVLAAAIGAMHPLLAQTRSTVATVSGMPAVVDPTNLYSETAAGKFDDRTRDVPHRVYVPNVTDGSVTVIDPLTMKIIDRFDAGRSPHHVVPSYDLKTLWVAALDEYGGKGGALTPIDARTGKPGKSVPVPDAYNLYFTPDGSAAVVVAEGLNRLEYRDPQTMELRATLPIEGCAGINHADFSIDGSFALFTCEFGGTVIKVDLIARKVLGLLKLSRGGMPQDIRIAPDGSVFFVADMMADGVFVISAETFTEIGFVPTGLGSHGLYPSRDGKKLYVANRGTHRITGAAHPPGSVSVIDFATRKVEATWPISLGGSPDMGAVSADGSQLWLSGRYDDEVYVFDTRSGAVRTISGGSQPHGLTYWPQPGRYSLGHTANLR
ncbi:MAG: YncE family protein [Bauldia sp.]